MKVKGRIKKAGWMNADGQEAAARQDDMKLGGFIERLHK